MHAACTTNDLNISSNELVNVITLIKYCLEFPNVSECVQEGDS